MNDDKNQTSDAAKRKALGLFVGVLVGSVAGLIGVDMLRTGQVDLVRLLITLLGALVGAGIVALLLMRR